MLSPAQPPTEAPLPPLIVICGPTATGKTGLSLELAERLPGAEIISADSRQVYRGMDIGTAKVSAAERSRVPHHCLDLVDPDEPFTAADFQRHALRALAEVGQRGGTALLVGGTGLYLRTVAHGMPLTETGRDPAIRDELERRLETDGLPALVADLRRLAPTLATRTDLANPRRVVRSLERAAIAGDRPPPAPHGYPGRVVWLGLQMDPEEHRQRIEDRVRGQFRAGFLEEAAALRAKYPATLPVFSAVGYRECFAVLDGTLTATDAAALIITRTSQLARRQRTWFRSEPAIKWLPPGEDALPAAVAVLEGLDPQLVDDLGDA